MRKGASVGPMTERCPGVNTLHCNRLRVENVTARMSEAELDLVERLAAERGVSRSDAIRQAIRQGAREELVRIALERYREGKLGMRRAADLADVTIAEMMAEANDRGVVANLDENELGADVDALR